MAGSAQWHKKSGVPVSDGGSIFPEGPGPEDPTGPLGELPGVSWLPPVPMVTEPIGNPLRVNLPLRLSLTDHLRSLATFGTLAAAAPWLETAPRGQGQPVLVLPGLSTGDLSTLPLRRWLSHMGYSAYGWGLGLNFGPTRRVMGSLPLLVDEMAVEHGMPVTVIGWSLGGNFARHVARQNPAAVRQVITLGSPIRLTSVRQVASMGMYSKLERWHVPVDERPQHELTLGYLPVPSSAIYSKCDGVVDWRACMIDPGPTAENIAIHGSHTGLGHDPSAFWAIADRLGQRGNSWKPFVAPPWSRGWIFPEVEEPTQAEAPYPPLM